MTVRLPPMSALRAFEAVARTGSLTRAAESLHLTHGAISHQIKALEDEIGVQLLERAGRGVRLSDEGARFAERVRAALTELSEAMREASDRVNPRQLRVSVVPSFAARWLLPRLGRFLAAHRDIDIDVRANMAVVDFQHDDVDVAIRYGLGSWPGVIAEHLMDDEYLVVCSPRYNGGRLPTRPEDLPRYTLLRSDDEFWKPWFDAAGVDLPEPSRGPIFNDASHMLQAAIEGQGIGLARRSYLGEDLNNGLLVRLFDVSVPSPRRFFLVYPPRLKDSPKLAAFRRFMQDELEADRKRVEREKGARRTRSGKLRALTP